MVKGSGSIPGRSLELSVNGDSTTPVFDFPHEPGFWLLLAGTVLSVIGEGKVSFGTLFGAFCGMLVSAFSPPLLSSLLERLPGGGNVLDSAFQQEIVSSFFYIGLTLLGCILGGWLFLKKLARLHHARRASGQLSPASRDP
jgi:hypothetical protein